MTRSERVGARGLVSRRQLLTMGAGFAAAPLFGSFDASARGPSTDLIVPNLRIGAAQQAEMQAWYHWSVSPVPREKMEKLANEEWAPDHPGSSLTFTQIPASDHEAKYTAAFSAGRGPDLFTEHAYIYGRDLNIAAPLPDDLAQIYEDGVVDVVKPYYKVEGRWYGVPFIPVGNLGLWLYYNTEHFKEAGLDPEQPPQTMSEMWEYARELVKLDGNDNVIQSGFAHQLEGDPGALAGKFYPVLHAYGGRLYEPQTLVADGYVNSPGGIAALEVLQRNTVGDDKVSSITLGLGEEQMARGQASMIFRESSFVGFFRDNAPDLQYKISYIPPEEEEGAGPTGSNWSFMVNDASEAKEAAFDFLRAMANPQYDLEVAEAAGQLPAWKENWDSSYLRERPDYAALQYTQEHNAGIFYLHPKTSEVAQAYGKILLEVARGDKEPEAAANEAATTIDRILGQSG